MNSNVRQFVFHFGITINCFKCSTFPAMLTPSWSGFVMAPTGGNKACCYLFNSCIAEKESKLIHLSGRFTAIQIQYTACCCARTVEDKLSL